MKNKIATLIALVFTLTMMAIGFGQGCAKSQKSDADQASTGPTDNANQEYQIDPNAATLAMVYNKQVLDHMVSCSGIGVASDSTLSTWAAKRGAVSIDGSVLTITSPMLMAVTTIAGDVCRDLIESEKMNPRIFNNVNWSATSLPSSNVLGDSIRGLALSCWQRPEADEERNFILDAMSSQFGTGNINNSDAFLFLCTSMLSSLDTLTL